MTEVRETFLGLVHNEEFIRRALLHMVNNRVQDFQDPLTSTLVLMATASLQIVLCDSGLLVCKTSLLPVMQYALFSQDERARLHALLQRMDHDQLYETIESSGQYTLTVLPFNQNQGSSASVFHLCNQRLLTAFVDVMMTQKGCDRAVNSALCNIVLQRFWSRVSTPSDVVTAIMHRLSSFSNSQQPQPPPPAAAAAGIVAAAEAAAEANGCTTTTTPPKKRAKTATAVFKTSSNDAMEEEIIVETTEEGP